MADSGGTFWAATFFASDFWAVGFWQGVSNRKHRLKFKSSSRRMKFAATQGKSTA